MDFCQIEDPTIRDYCEWQRSSWCMDEILAMDETFSEEEMSLMGRYEPYLHVGDAQKEPHNKKALLEEALSGIGMRQLLPQISISHDSNMAEELRQLHYPSLGSSEAHMQYFNSGASVFVPVSNAPAQVVIKTEASTVKGADADLKSCHSLVSSMGSWHSSSEACVPDLSPRAPLGTPRSSARVPDYFCGGFGPDPDCPDAQMHGAVLCSTRQLRPRMRVKAEDDFETSDEEKRTAANDDFLDDMPRIVPDSISSINRSECLQRYRDKKQRRHFTHKVRYTARKLNADRRPRIKGRFVKACDLNDLAGEV